MRTIIDLPEEQLAALGEICERTGISRAEAVRRAVGRFLAEEVTSTEIGSDEAFASWRGRIRDPLAYEDELRGPPDQDARPARRAVRQRRKGS